MVLPINPGSIKIPEPTSVKDSDTKTYLHNLLKTLRSNFSDLADQILLLQERQFSVGMLYMQGNATATTITTQNIWVKVAGDTTGSTNSTGFDSTTNDNRLEYTSTREGLLNLSFIVSGTGTSTDALEFAVFKNGSIITESTVSTTLGGTSFSNIVGQTIIDFSPNDYFEIFVRNISSTNNVTITDLNFIVKEL